MDKTYALHSFLVEADRKGFFQDAYEKTLFISFADTLMDAVSKNIPKGTVMPATSWFKLLQQVYSDTFKPLVNQTRENEKRLQKALEDQMKYGTKITVVFKDKEENPALEDTEEAMKLNWLREQIDMFQKEN